MAGALFPGPMMKDADRVVYDILLEREVVPKETLDGIVARLDERTRLEALVFKEGFLNSQQLMEIVRSRDERLAELKASEVIKPTPEDFIFGKMVVSRNLADTERVRQCMRLALRMRRDGNPASLAQVVVAQGVLDHATAQQIQVAIRGRLATCTKCGTTYLPTAVVPGQPYRCPRCETHRVPSGSGAPPGAPPVARSGVAPSVASYAPRTGAAPQRAAPQASPPGLVSSTAGSQLSNTLLGSGMRPRPPTPPPAPAVAAVAAAAGAPAGEEGRPFGKYLILEEIARGGMGIVYKARQRDLGRIVALKILKAGGDATAEEEERFRREAESIARLSHPNIVAIYDVGEEEGLPYFAMEFLEGSSLDDLILEGSLDYREGLELVCEVIRGVAYAHERGIIHRDLKPANILLDSDGRPRITDFGLAKSMDVESRLTKEGTALGTPYYMAPEQFEGIRDVDHRTDIYALGVILYEVLTGTLPFEGETPVEVYTKIMGQDPTPLRTYNPAIHRDVETICLKALHRDKEQRYQSSAEFVEDIERYLAGLTIQARRPNLFSRAGRAIQRNRWATIALGVVALAAAILGFVAVRLYTGYQRDLRAAEARGYVGEGTRALEARNWAAAAAAFTQALEVEPENPDALMGRARALHASGSEDAALADLDQLAEVSGGSPDVLRLRAEVNRLRGQFDQAIRDLDALVVEAPRDPAPLVERGLAYVAAGRPGEALADFRTAAGLPGNTARACLEAGRLLADTDANQAIEYFSRAIATDGQLVEAFCLRGRLLIAASRLEEARGDFTHALEIDPANGAAQRGRGDALYLLGRADDALRDYQRYLQANPSAGDAEIYHRLGRIYLGQLNVMEARRWIERALQADDDDASCHVAMAMIYVGEGRQAEADAELVRAQDLDPTLAEPYSYRGQVRIPNLLFGQENAEAIVTYFDQALARSPDDADALACRGLAYFARSQAGSTGRTNRAPLDAALNDLERALTLSPRGDFMRLIWLGLGGSGPPLTAWVHDRLALTKSVPQTSYFNPEQAIDHARQAVTLMDRYWGFWNTYSIANAAAQDYCTAAQALERAIQYLPPNASANLRTQLNSQLATYRSRCR